MWCSPRQMGMNVINFQLTQAPRGGQGLGVMAGVCRGRGGPRRDPSAVGAVYPEHARS